MGQAPESTGDGLRKSVNTGDYCASQSTLVIRQAPESTGDFMYSGII